MFSCSASITYIYTLDHTIFFVMNTIHTSEPHTFTLDQREVYIISNMKNKSICWGIIVFLTVRAVHEKHTKIQYVQSSPQ